MQNKPQKHCKALAKTLKKPLIKYTYSKAFNTGLVVWLLASLMILTTTQIAMANAPELVEPIQLVSVDVKKSALTKESPTDESDDSLEQASSAVVGGITQIESAAMPRVDFKNVIEVIKVARVKNNKENIEKTAQPQTDKKLNGIVRVSEIEKAQEPNTNEKEPGYVDVLIDPNVAEDSIDEFLIDSDPSGFNLYQNFDFRAETRVDEQNQRDTIAGIGYTAIKETGNYGRFTLDLVFSGGNEEFSDFGDDINNNDDGIRYYSLEQNNLPLTPSVYMNNIIGTHRLNRDTRYSRNLVSRRFNSVDPDILGVTSQLFSEDTSLTLSFGELGNREGLVLKGYEKDDGSIQRAQLSQAFSQHLVSTEIWNTSSFDDSSDQNSENNFIDSPNNGYRVTVDTLYGADWKSSLTFAGSEDAISGLVGAENSNQRFRQDFGAYYYEPNFAWLNRQVDEDSLGTYYRFSDQNYFLTYGASGEFRRQGIDSDEIDASDTYFFNVPLGYRIDRNKRANLNLRLRHLDDRNIRNLDNSYIEYGFRTNLSVVHNESVRSSFGFDFSRRDGEIDANTDKRYGVDYSYSQDLGNDSLINFSLEYERDEQDSGLERNEYSADVGWQKDFDQGQSFNARLGYFASDTSNGVDNDGLNASAGLAWPITDNLFFNIQADYNRNILDQDDFEVQNGLVTEDEPFNDVVFDDTDSYSIFLSVQYTLDGSKRDSVIGQRRGAAGSGAITGYVFVDENLDGIRQLNEQGLAGVDVYLDSIYPTRTDQNGLYRFPKVGTGDHFIFVEESDLPLPWSLYGEAFKGVEVKLRGTARLNIPVTSEDANLAPQFE